MPRYYFRIPHGEYSGGNDLEGEFTDADLALTEMTKVCGDLVGGIVRKMNQNAEWQIELLDEAKRPVFRIALVAENARQIDPPVTSEIGVAGIEPALCHSTRRQFGGDHRGR